MKAATTRPSSGVPGGSRRDLIAVRLFQRLNTIRRFAQWGGSILSGVTAGLRTWIGRLAGRPGPVDDAQDLRCVPGYYQELVESLELPDRPALSRFERALPGEASAIRTVARIAASAVVSGYCDARKADTAARAMRDQHAKHHACLAARFVVHSDLPADLAVGVFRGGQIYEAVVRFSNAMGKPQGDRKADGRGMAVKLMTGAGANILSTLVPGGRGGEQDFLMTNHPVFFCRDIADYTEFMSMLAAPADTWARKIRGMNRFVLFFVPWRLRQLGIFVTHSIKRTSSPLRATYHSMTPYLLGDQTVVRYSATPVQTPRAVFPSGSAPSSDNVLHDTLAAELDPARHDAGEKAIFDFSVRIRQAATADDVEDASLWWQAPNDRTISLGRIEIPLQSFARSDQLCTCENLSFNPWNALPEHRPLGGLNRMRLAVYLASMHVRHRLNML